MGGGARARALFLTFLVEPRPLPWAGVACPVLPRGAPDDLTCLVGALCACCCCMHSG